MSLGPKLTGLLTPRRFRPKELLLFGTVAQVAQAQKHGLNTKLESLAALCNQPAGAMEFYLRDSSPVAAPFPGQDNRDYGDQAAACLN